MDEKLQSQLFELDNIFKLNVEESLKAISEIENNDTDLNISNIIEVLEDNPFEEKNRKL